MNLSLKAKDYTSLYIQLGRLLENAPSTTDAGAFRTQEALHWLGRGDALVTEVGVGAGMDAIEFRSAMKSLKDSVCGNV